ncbi:MAG: sulfatase-like hydrolase/transferase [Deltaproteobacteria bacterium]|nr:sulfatase-like hydrolase/transferase [Deltaproteobacteria bacterium]
MAIPVSLLALFITHRTLKLLRLALHGQEPTLRRATVGALLFLGGCAYVADMLLYRRLYSVFHGLAALTTLVAFMGAMMFMQRPPTPWYRHLSSLFATGVFVFALFLADLSLGATSMVRVVSMEYTNLAAKVLTLIRLPERLFQREGEQHLPDVSGGLGSHQVEQLQQRLGLCGKRIPHIFFFSIDALRAQSLAIYQPEEVTTPALLALARKGHLFERAYAPGPETVASVGSWVTATIPARHVEKSIYQRIGAGGYQTICLIPWSFVAPAFDLPATPGCDIYHSISKLGWLDATFRQSISTISKQRPLFAHIHVMATHDPQKLPGHDRKSAYEAEIQRVDRYLGTWIELLRSKGLLDHAMVIVSADHGESLGENGVYGHGSSLRAEQTHVPLLIWTSHGVPSRISEPVSVGWLGQTILAASGVVPHHKLSAPFIFSKDTVSICGAASYSVVNGASTGAEER